MDKLINAGKQFLEEQSQNHGQGQGQGQSHLPGGNKAHGGNYPAGGDFQDDDDLKDAHQEASHHAGSSGSSDMFSSIIGAIGQKKGQIANEDIDEQDAIRQHKNTYGNEGGNHDEKSLGTAAAMQALKMFNQRDSSQKQSQGAFLGLAMSEASKLFDDKAAQGKVQSGASKQSAVQQAGEMAMKMYFKSQGQQQGGMMGLASKFF